VLQIALAQFSFRCQKHPSLGDLSVKHNADSGMNNEKAKTQVTVQGAV
jgi:hypothetical protein